MAFEHESGLADAHDRAVGKSDQQMVVYVADRPVQSAELNEMQTIARGRHRRVSNLVAKDGDRVEGAEAMVDIENGTVLLASGRIYVAGDVLPVPSTLLLDVPMTGTVVIGIRLVKSWITGDDDATLRGLVPGTEAEGEDGAARELAAISWALSTDGQPGEFFQVYTLMEGTIIDQLPPPALTGIMQQLGVYDFDANGHYIVDGCDVSCLGKAGDDWVFSIGAGTANVQGFKRIRSTSLRFPVEESVELEDVVAETHNYGSATGTPVTVEVNRAPMQSLTSAVIIKRAVENVIRGAVPGTADNLAFNSVYQVESVVMGGTTYLPTTNFVVTGGQINWSPAGTEPGAGNTYVVTYLYSATVVPTTITETSVTVTGGVKDKPITLRYLSKIPRIDLICLEVSGAPVYVKGIPARSGGMAPIEPGNLLKLAEVENNWLTLPRVVNNGVRNFTYAQMKRLFGRLVDVLDQFDRQTALLKIAASTPVAKKGIFTDNFVDDYFRDQGLAQTAACNQGVLQLGIDATLLQLISGVAQTKPYTEMVVVSQPLATASMKINPYASFDAMPAGMRLAPAVDFWTEEQTQWTSAITREFSAAPGQPPGQTTINEVTEIRRVVAKTLRQIPITVTLEGFGVGEKLKGLLFDGVNVKPPGTQTADANGEIALSFVIPANVPVGQKLVEATGMAGSFAEAIFVGEGTVDVTTMRRVTLVSREAPPPVIEVTHVTNVTQVTNVTVNNITNVTVRRRTVDPLAQTFQVPAPYMVIGVNFKITAVGNRAKGVRVQLATVANGYPTAEILAETYVSMATVQVGDKVEARFDLPVYCAPWSEYCFVILTDDAEHSIAISRLGDVITATQQRVGKQPYTTGVMFSSANRLTWTPHQDADIHFEIVAAKFDAADRVVNLWTGNLANISDLLVRGTVEVPTEEAGFRYELVRASGQVIKIAPGQAIEFAEYVTEVVTLRAVLTGNDRISPVLYPGTILAGGSLRATGDYVTRSFDFGNAVKLAALFAAKLPSGATVAVDGRVGVSAWQPLALISTGILGDGWTEPKFELNSITGPVGQVRLTLTGTPAARPSLAMARAYTI